MPNWPGAEHDVPVDDADAPAPYSSLGLGLASAGVFLVLLAYSFLDWFRDGTGFFAGAGASTSFGQVRGRLDRLHDDAVRAGIGDHVSFGASRPYFTWLGWLLLALAAVLTGVAISRFGARHWFAKWLGAVASVAGVSLTFLALNLFVFEGNAANNAGAPNYGDFIGNSGPGAWAAIVGFLLLTIAALVPHPAR